MLYALLAFLVAGTLIARAALPSRKIVFGSQEVQLPGHVKLRSRYVGAGLLRDESGKRLDVRGKFVGCVFGNSMAAFGIPNGTTFVGDFLSKRESSNLVRGDIVVVEGVPKLGESGLQLRIIDKIGNATASFALDGYGRPTTPRPITELCARVTHTVDVKSHKPGYVLGKIEKLLGIRDANISTIAA